MKRVLTSTLLIALAISCEAPVKFPGYEGGIATAAAEVKAIPPGPEVSQQDAEKIMCLYFFTQTHLGSCGGPQTPAVKKGDFWVANIRWGYVAQLDPNPIKVQISTGKITWGNGPSFDTPQALATAALTLRSSRTPPALPSALSQHLAIPAPLAASVQAWPLSFLR